MTEHGSARERAEQRIEQVRVVYESHGRLFRAMWLAVAVVIVLVGLAMVVVPGPATLVIPLGLAMLAVVFGWARHLLVHSLEVGEGAADRFRRAGPLVKLLTVAVVLSGSAGVAIWLWA